MKRLAAIAAAIAAAGIVGEDALREAAASEFGQVSELISGAVRRVVPDGYIVAMFPDRAIVCGRGGRYYAYPYTIDDTNQVTLGSPVEVVKEFVPASGNAPAREAVDAHPKSKEARTDSPARQREDDRSAIRAGEVFLEAVTEGDKPTRYLVRVIRAGTSLNNVTYPASVLREAASLFDGVRVFVKSDEQHLKGGGKDFRQLVGRLTEAKFVDTKDGGEIQAVLDVLESSDVAAKLREAVQRGMTDLFGLSIDAYGRSKKTGKFREAISLTKVASVDLIIEPGAGGQFIRFTEAKATPNEETDMLREQMMKAIAARDAKRAEGLADASDEQILEAYREAVATPAKTETPASVTQEQIDERFRMIEARADARVTIAEAKLPKAIKDRLTTRFAEAASFEAEDVTAAIEAERKFLGELNDGAKVTGLGEFVEAGEDRADKVKKMLDDFFDRSKPAMSFKECYIDITGDRRVTGLMRDMDMNRLREAVGDANFREAINAATFGNVLGDSITRAMVRDYQNGGSWADWRWLADVVPVSDFRTQERTRMGGFGDLPAVAEGAAYTELAAPGDEKATYAISKRGGLETITLETIANDDVGVIRRVPLKLGTAAARTLYKFVYSFLDGNGLIYDGTALFVAGHSNIGTAALDATSYAAARLRMFKQKELTSNEPLGIPLRHLAVPSDLEGAAHDLFARSTNLDKTFVQSQDPTVHVVTHWTDANNWYGTADKADCPLIEVGFYNGQETPELFVQDQPTNGSVFTNDKITYKLRHIYSGAVIDFRGFDGSIVA